jgi:hypothetical protein
MQGDPSPIGRHCGSTQAVTWLLELPDESGTYLWRNFGTLEREQCRDVDVQWGFLIQEQRRLVEMLVTTSNCLVQRMKYQESVLIEVNPNISVAPVAPLIKKSSYAWKKVALPPQRPSSQAVQLDPVFVVLVPVEMLQIRDQPGVATMQN